MAAYVLNDYPFSTLLCAFLLIIIFRYNYVWRALIKLPMKGPFCFPFLGNFETFSPSQSTPHQQRLCGFFKKYDPVTAYKIGQQTVRVFSQN